MDKTENILHEKSYKGKNLANANFSEADLRGVDFSDTILTNADFSKCRTGLKTPAALMVFIISLIISMLSGYLAMLAGATFQYAINSSDPNIVWSGYITAGLVVLFILYTILKGGKNFLLFIGITITLVLIIGLISRLSGAGTGMGSIYGSLTLVIFAIMSMVGIIARASAGTLSSNIIFLVVAIGGATFGRTIGGGLETVVLAVACAVLSKQVLSKPKSFPVLIKTALIIGTYFGTSFKNADLKSADFSEAIIGNTNFTGADLTGVNWDNSKKAFNLEEN